MAPAAGFEQAESPPKIPLKTPLSNSSLTPVLTPDDFQGQNPPSSDLYIDDNLAELIISWQTLPLYLRKIIMLIVRQGGEK